MGVTYLDFNLFKKLMFFIIKLFNLKCFMTIFKNHIKVQVFDSTDEVSAPTPESGLNPFDCVLKSLPKMLDFPSPFIFNRVYFGL